MTTEADVLRAARQLAQSTTKLDRTEPKKRATATRNYTRQAALVEQLPGSDPARFRFLASTTALQGDGLAIPSEAWDLSRYRRHGPVLLNHRLDSLPIGRAERVWTTERGLWCDIVLDDDDPLAAQVASKIRRGFLTGVSVNFRVHERQGSTVKRCELVEISVVSTPEDAGVELVAMRSVRQSRRAEIAAIRREIDAHQGSLRLGLQQARLKLALAMIGDLQNQERAERYGRY